MVPPWYYGRYRVSIHGARKSHILCDHDASSTLVCCVSYANRQCQATWTVIWIICFSVWVILHNSDMRSDTVSINIPISMEPGSISVLQFRLKDEMWRAWCQWCISAKARQFECGSINSLSSALGQNGLLKNGLCNRDTVSCSVRYWFATCLWCATEKVACEEPVTKFVLAYAMSDLSVMSVRKKGNTANLQSHAGLLINSCPSAILNRAVENGRVQEEDWVSILLLLGPGKGIAYTHSFSLLRSTKFQRSKHQQSSAADAVVLRPKACVLQHVLSEVLKQTKKRIVLTQAGKKVSQLS